MKRHSGGEDLKIMRLFDALEKLPDYNEQAILKKLKDVEKPQLSNLKTHLYKQLLASLRDLKSKDSIELQLNELLDYGRILYAKGLFQQSMRFLERAKELGFKYGKYNFLSQVISLEKKIEALHITRSMPAKTEQLEAEALEVSSHIYRVFQLSNLALGLQRFYIKNGHARDKEDEKGVRLYFNMNLPAGNNKNDGFYENLYLYQCYCWYAFIRQDFLMYYRYAQKWVDLFENEPIRIGVETGMYIRAMHTLLNAHFDLRNYRQFAQTIEKFEDFAETDECKQHDNFRVHTYVYLTAARLNWHLITGTFSEALQLVPDMEKQLQHDSIHLDQHRIMVFQYKTATVYFGNGDYSTAIDYLQDLIGQPVDLRYDLQCYARLVHLLSHYELGNYELVEYLSKSVYRFMAKMKNLTKVEQEIFKFLRTSFRVSPKQLQPELENLLQRIKHLENDRYETRAFAYLDVISWVESKVYRKTMSQIVHAKYMASPHR